LDDGSRDFLADVVAFLRLDRGGHVLFGLAVRVAPSGVKTWDLAFRIRGSAKTRRISLGRVTDISLEAARERAAELTRAGRAGRDLIAEEESARAVAASRLTVEQLIAEFTRRRLVGRLRTASEIERRLKRALGPILHRFPNEIRRRDIRELLDAAADHYVIVGSGKTATDGIVWLLTNGVAPDRIVIEPQILRSDDAIAVAEIATQRVERLCDDAPPLLIGGVWPQKTQ